MDIDLDKYNFKDNIKPEITLKGLSEDVVREISEIKEEPKWMLEFRLKGYYSFLEKPMPSFGPKLDLDFDDLIYYAKYSNRVSSWDEVPDEIKDTFDKLGIPEAERRFLAGLEAQYDSEAIYSHLKDQLEKLGVVFIPMDEAVKRYPNIVKKYISKVVPISDNKFSALNSAVWSGGSFVYVPSNVNVPFPLQAYFRLNLESIAQFERTLIIAEENSKVHYIEGCTAPYYSKDSLHTGVVEVIAKQNSHVRYTTIQNWSKNVYNLVTQRAHVYKNAFMEWVDGNLGSKITMKYPAVVLKEQGAKGRILSIGYASSNQIQDAGAKAIHLAPDTYSEIISKSISKDGGSSIYRGLVVANKDSISSVQCDALLLDKDSSSSTYPTIIASPGSVVSHEASVANINEENLFYLMSKGLKEGEAKALIVLGFINLFTEELPMEYALELNKLINLQMEGAIG